MATSSLHRGWKRAKGETAATNYISAYDLGIEGIRITKSSTGCDVRLLGDTPASNYVLWDASAGNLGITATITCTGEQHCFDITSTGAVTSGDSFVGANVLTTVTGSAASWVSAFYCKTTQASKVVNGYLCAAEFELTSTAANASANGVICLNSTRNHTGSAPGCGDPYIILRDYGTTYAKALLWIYGDTGQGDTSTLGTSSLITSAQDTYEAGCNCAVRCVSGSTAFWLLGSTTAPTS